MRGYPSSKPTCSGEGTIQLVADLHQQPAVAYPQEITIRARSRYSALG